jgi:hypothetical protein
MNLQKTFSSLMTNKYFLYFIVVLSAVNIIGYLTMNNTDAVIFFALLGFIMFNFSKNMTIVLLVSMIATNLFMVSKPFTSFEAFSEGNEGPTKIGTQKQSEGKGGSDVELEGIEVKDAVQKYILEEGDVAEEDVVEEEEEEVVKPKKKPTTTTTAKKPTKKVEPISSKTGRSEGFDLSPAPVKKSSHIDYATTLEDAYKNLEKMLGNGGLQNLTTDTKKLMDQQTKLFNSMENITPMLAQAQQMMKGMDMNSINKFAGSAKSFNKSDA